MRRLLLRPPRVLSVVALVWLAVILLDASDTGTGITALFMFLFGGAALLVVWVLRLVLFLWRRPSGPDSRRISRWFAVTPAALLVSLLSGVLGAPNGPLFRIRFVACRQALTQEARAALARAPFSSTEPRRVGLFTVRRMQARDGQVRFITANCGVIDSCGLIFVETGRPTRWQEDIFTHIDGPWWHVFEGF